MEEIIDEVVTSDVLKKFEAVYNKQLEEGNVTRNASFDYACCLVRSRYAADIRKGICLLEKLYSDGSEEERRDYIYYLSLGHTKLKEYPTALRYVRAFLNIEPANSQVQNLETIIKKRMEREGIIGMAMTGGAVLVAGGLVAVGYSIAKALVKK